MSDHVLDENETRLRLVNPALASAGWPPAQIAEEVATGRVGRDGVREPGRADYVLHLRSDRKMLPVAVLEVKSESREPDDGIEQAAEYARALSVPHALATNGREFVSVDLATGAVASPRPLVEFPSPSDLRADAAELNESVHVRKRRLSDVEIRDEHGQVIEDRRLRRTVFALWKRGWSENQDGSQPLGMRLTIVRDEDDDEGDVPFVLEFVPPGNEREPPTEVAAACLFLLGNLSVAKLLKIRLNRVVETPSPGEASLLYFSDGRYFTCEDRIHRTQTDQLPLSHFPTPEEVHAMVKPRLRQKRSQGPPRSSSPGSESARPQTSANTQRSAPRSEYRGGRNRPRRSPAGARHPSSWGSTAQSRNTDSSNSADHSLDDRAKMVRTALGNRGWRQPEARGQRPEQPANQSVSLPRQYKLSGKIDGRVADIAIILVVSDAPFHPRHIDQAVRLAERDNLRVAFVSNGESYVMRKLPTGRQTSPLPMSLFPSPSELRRGMADRPRPRSSDPLHREAPALKRFSISSRPKSFWKRLFGR